MKIYKLIPYILLLQGCALHQIVKNSNMVEEISPVRPLDEIQNWESLFLPLSKESETNLYYERKGKFYSSNPSDYINRDTQIATAIPTTLGKGLVISPWAPKSGIVDVRNFKENQIVICPFSKKLLRVPNERKFASVNPLPTKK